MWVLPSERSCRNSYLPAVFRLTPHSWRSKAAPQSASPCTHSARRLPILETRLFEHRLLSFPVEARLCCGRPTRRRSTHSPAFYSTLELSQEHPRGSRTQGGVGPPQFATKVSQACLLARRYSTIRSPRATRPMESPESRGGRKESRLHQHSRLQPSGAPNFKAAEEISFSCGAACRGARAATVWGSGGRKWGARTKELLGKLRCRMGGQSLNDQRRHTAGVWLRPETRR